MKRWILLTGLLATLLWLGGCVAPSNQTAASTPAQSASLVTGSARETDPPAEADASEQPASQETSWPQNSPTPAVTLIIDQMTEAINYLDKAGMQRCLTETGDGFTSLFEEGWQDISVFSTYYESIHVKVVSTIVQDDNATAHIMVETLDMEQAVQIILNHAQNDESVQALIEGDDDGAFNAYLEQVLQNDTRIRTVVQESDLQLVKDAVTGNWRIADNIVNYHAFFFSMMAAFNNS